MADIPDIELGGTIDPVLASLIVQMMRSGALSGPDLSAMARRLDPDDAEALMALAAEASLDDSPEAMRAGLRLVSDGGNDMP